MQEPHAFSQPVRDPGNVRDGMKVVYNTVLLLLHFGTVVRARYVFHARHAVERRSLPRAFCFASGMGSTETYEGAKESTMERMGSCYSGTVGAPHVDYGDGRKSTSEKRWPVS